MLFFNSAWANKINQVLLQYKGRQKVFWLKSLFLIFCMAILGISSPVFAQVIIADFENPPVPQSSDFNNLGTVFPNGSGGISNSSGTAGFFTGPTPTVAGVTFLTAQDGVSYSGLHSVGRYYQEVVIADISGPDQLQQNNFYTVSLLSYQMNLSLPFFGTEFNNPGYMDVFGIRTGTPSPTSAAAQANSAVIGAQPGIDLLGSTPLISNTAAWQEYLISFTAAHDYDRILFAPRSRTGADGDGAFLALDRVRYSNIVSTDDSVTGISGVSGAAAVVNAFTNDTISLVAASPTNATLSVAPGAVVPAGLTFSTATGDVDVAPGTAAGTYSFDYQICAVPSTTNCSRATITVTVAPSVDLALTKTNTPGVNGNIDQANDSVLAGSVTTYTITVTNNGPDVVTGAIVTDTLGTGLNCPATLPVTMTGSGVPSGSFTISNLTGSGIVLDTLAVGESTTLTYSCLVQ